jgi:acyl carrier protein
VSDTEQRITDFVTQNFLFGDSSRLPGRDDSLVELGIIDSTGILEVIEFIESDFGIQVTDAETIPENLGTMSRIAAFVDRKRSDG